MIACSAYLSITLSALRGPHQCKARCAAALVGQCLRTWVTPPMSIHVKMKRYQRRIRRGSWCQGKKADAPRPVLAIHLWKDGMTMMTNGPTGRAIRRLHSSALARGIEMTDGQLLEPFVSRKDEAALEPLVLRHGPMVLGVCRRILGHSHDAGDAFQAVFLVLVRKAASVGPRE